MEIDYKEVELPKGNTEFQLAEEDAKYEEKKESQVLTHNFLEDYDLFYALKDWRNQTDVIDDIFSNVRSYFSRDGGIAYSFMMKHSIFSTIFEILIESISESPTHFNIVFDIIDQIILHTPDTVDYFAINDFDIIDQINEIVDPFFDDKCLECDSFIPEIFSEPAFNVNSIDICVSIILNLCLSNQKIKILYNDNFLKVLSNMLRMKTTDNQIRDLQIIDCLYLILIKSPNRLISKVNDCQLVFQAYSSVFERFKEDQSCIDSVIKICKYLSEILEKESMIVFFIFQNGFYEMIPFILDYIYSIPINTYALIDIAFFIFETLSIGDDNDNDNENNKSEEEKEEDIIDSIITKIGSIIGDEHPVSALYNYILNITVGRMGERQQDSPPPFTILEQRAIGYFFDSLERLIMILDSPIIEYPKIDELFSVISEFGNFELKISFYSFVIGMIQVLSVDQLHDFLKLDFMPYLFDNFVSSEPDEAGLVLDIIYDILPKLGVTNELIVEANQNIENIEDNEILLIIQSLPELLKSFLDYEDENKEKAEIIISQFYQGII